MRGNSSLFLTNKEWNKLLSNNRTVDDFLFVCVTRGVTQTTRYSSEATIAAFDVAEFVFLVI